jgi:hypothetical protein
VQDVVARALVGRDLEAVVGVVAAQDDGVGARERALEVALEKLVGLVLVAGHLQHLGELALFGGVAARETLLLGDPLTRAHDDEPADRDARSGKEQDHDDRQDLAAGEGVATARVDGREEACVRRAEAVHDRLAPKRGGCARALAAAAHTVGRLLGELLPRHRYL